MRQWDGLEQQREKIEIANRNLTDRKKIGNQTSRKLQKLLSTRNLSSQIKSCALLELSTKFSLRCCYQIVEKGGIGVLFSLIRACNRSEPHLVLLRSILIIFSNIVQHRVPELAVEIFEAHSSVDTLVDLMQMYRDRHDIFHKSAGLLDSLLRLDDRHPIIVAQMDNVCTRMQSILQLLEKKLTLKVKYSASHSRGAPPPSATAVDNNKKQKKGEGFEVEREKEGLRQMERSISLLTGIVKRVDAAKRKLLAEQRQEREREEKEKEKEKNENARKRL